MHGYGLKGPLESANLAGRYSKERGNVTSKRGRRCDAVPVLGFQVRPTALGHQYYARRLILPYKTNLGVQSQGCEADNVHLSRGAEVQQN